MNAIDCIQNFASNMRNEQFLLSSAQVMLAIVNGKHRHKTIHASTNLHPNTVSSIIKCLIEQGYVNKFGDSRPYVYRATSKGEHLAYKLLKKPDKKEIRSCDMEEDLLTIKEKRKWLAEIFRNTEGEYCQSDRFKALVEDTKLAAIQKEEEEHSRQEEKTPYAEKLYALFKGIPSPDPVARPSGS